MYHLSSVSDKLPNVSVSANNILLIACTGSLQASA